MEVQKQALSQILPIADNTFYHIPKYQRAYTWKKENWEALYDDIDSNDLGHFLGAIICVKKNKEDGQTKIYDVIDGQQRLTTLSIFLMALYNKSKMLMQEVGWNEDLLTQVSDLKRQLIYSSNDKLYDKFDTEETEGNRYKYLRLVPSTQKSNYEDYKYVLKNELGLISRDMDQPSYYSRRGIKKAYDYFTDRLNKLEASSKDFRSALMNLNNKVQSVNLINVIVGSSADAFIIFETVNNRGIPLTAIDIIKNKVLADLEKQKQSVDVSYEEWNRIIENLNDSNLQIRFLRQFYNGFQYLKGEQNQDRMKVKNVNKASKNSLIKIYETIVERDSNWILEQLIARSKSYKELVYAEVNNEALQKKLEDLSYVKAAPTYTTLLLLKDYANVPDKAMIEIVDVYIKFFTRRNITDTPPTRDLDTIQVKLAEKITKMVDNGDAEKLNGQWLYSELKSLTTISPLAEFRNRLNGRLYDENREMTRFLLIKLEESTRSKEQKIDFWERKKSGKSVWTIEHVFPQGNNIPKEWVQMIADGDEALAKEIQDEHVHRLGNLTMSVYNSNLSNKGLLKKQNQKLTNSDGTTVNIGYLNGLYLNELEFTLGDDSGKTHALKNVPQWTREHIESRGRVMIEKIIELFKFNDED